MYEPKPVGGANQSLITGQYCQSSITEWVELLTARGTEDEAYDGCVLHL